MIVDRLHQQNIAVMAWVFSKRQDDALRDYVTGTLHRSVTYWPATGAYQNSETNVMCICMSKYELEDFRHAMLEIDPDAFLVTDEGVRSTETITPGFNPESSCLRQELSVAPPFALPQRRQEKYSDRLHAFMQLLPCPTQ